MDPSLNSGFQNLQFSPNGQIQNVPRPMIQPISNNPSMQMNEADNIVQPFNFYQTIPRQDYQLNPNPIFNPYMQNPKEQMLKPQTSDYSIPLDQEHGQDYTDYTDYGYYLSLSKKTKCSKRKDCVKKLKDCKATGCMQCGCVKKMCQAKCTRCSKDMSCMSDGDCNMHCKCFKPNKCKCSKNQCVVTKCRGCIS